jgi:hypothetical protein
MLELWGMFDLQVHPDAGPIFPSLSLGMALSGFFGDIYIRLYSMVPPSYTWSTLGAREPE